MQENSVVLRRDVLGRVRASREMRAGVVEQFNRSGLSGAQFARLAGLKYPTLMSWVSRERALPAAGSPPLPKQPRLMEAVVAAPEITTALILHLGGGVRVEITEAAQIPLAARLILALQKPC